MDALISRVCVSKLDYTDSFVSHKIADDSFALGLIKAENKREPESTKSVK